MNFLEMESILNKAKEVDSLAVSVVKNKNVNEAVNFIAKNVEENLFILSLIAKENPQLATEIAINIKKQFPDEKDNIIRAVSMGAKGGDVYYKARQDQTSDTIGKLKELKGIADKRKTRASIVGNRKGQSKYTAISENIGRDIEKEEKSQRQYSSNSKVIQSQQNSFSAFLLNSLHSPDNDVLSKEKLISLCKHGIRQEYGHNYYQYGEDGHKIRLNEEDCHKVDEGLVNSFLEFYILKQPLADGVSQCVNSCIFPENVEKLDQEQTRKIVENIDGYVYDWYKFQGSLYKHLAVKYSEWLMEKEAPGFDLTDKFLVDRVYIDYKGYDTNYRENARAIFKELKTSEEIQKWMDSYGKVPLNEFLEKVPELKGIKVDEAASQVFVPANAALKYAKCRETYFPHQSVEECLNKSSKDTYPPTQSSQFLDLIAVAYALNKTVNSESPQNNKQKSQIILRENGGR